MSHTNAGGKLNSVTHIEMPYLGVDGSPTGSTPRRHAMTEADGKRFSWKKGSRTLLYGMQKLEEIHRLGWVLLVEGETDTLTGWQAGIPTLGIPGKATWKPEWAELLHGLEVVLWVEPDDVLMLCSDGLYPVVPHQEIRMILDANSPATACQKLVEHANASGGPDNIGVVVVRIPR